MNIYIQFGYSETRSWTLDIPFKFDIYFFLATLMWNNLYFFVPLVHLLMCFIEFWIRSRYLMFGNTINKLQEYVTQLSSGFMHVYNIYILGSWHKIHCWLGEWVKEDEKCEKWIPDNRWRTKGHMATCWRSLKASIYKDGARNLC